VERNTEGGESMSDEKKKNNLIDGADLAAIPLNSLMDNELDNKPEDYTISFERSSKIIFRIGKNPPINFTLDEFYRAIKHLKEVIE
jgi:hypothetical protein